MYYWHILNRNKEELLYKYYLAQKLKPHKSDWLQQVLQDLQDLRISLSEEQICSVSKGKFKKYVQQQIIGYTKNYLENLKQSHSKTRKLPVFSYKPDEFLLSNKLNKKEVQTLFKMKIRMLNVKLNFRSQYSDNLCSMCLVFPETQEHQINCSVIKCILKDVIDFKSLKYEFLYGTLAQQEQLAKVYTVIMTTREDILKNKHSSEDQSTLKE